MKPIKFKEQNFTLTKPSDMTDAECGPLYVHRTGSRIICCWKMNLAERIKALLYGRIWVDVAARTTHPPICVQCEKTVFVMKKSVALLRKALVKGWKKKLERELEEQRKR